MNKSDINNVKFPVSRAFVKIFHVKTTSSINWCQYYMNVLPIDYMLDARRFKYFSKMSKSKCFTMQHLFCKSANTMSVNICRKYNLQADCTYGKLIYTLWEHFRNSLIDL